MATAAGQAKAQQLNSKLENEARIVMDEIDKKYMRKVSREGHACALKCYDKAGSSTCAMRASVRAWRRVISNALPRDSVWGWCFPLLIFFFLASLTRCAFAGGSPESLEQCVQQCQMPSRQAGAFFQQVSS